MKFAGLNPWVASWALTFSTASRRQSATTKNENVLPVGSLWPLPGSGSVRAYSSASMTKRLVCGTKGVFSPRLTRCSHKSKLLSRTAGRLAESSAIVWRAVFAQCDVLMSSIVIGFGFGFGFLSASASGSPASKAFAAFDVGKTRDASSPAATAARWTFGGGRWGRRGGGGQRSGRGRRRHGVKKSEQPVCFGFGGGGGGHHWLNGNCVGPDSVHFHSSDSSASQFAAHFVFPVAMVAAEKRIGEMR